MTESSMGFMVVNSWSTSANLKMDPIQCHFCLFLGTMTISLGKKNILSSEHNYYLPKRLHQRCYDEPGGDNKPKDKGSTGRHLQTSESTGGGRLSVETQALKLMRRQNERHSEKTLNTLDAVPLGSTVSQYFKSGKFALWTLYMTCAEYLWKYVKYSQWIQVEIEFYNKKINRQQK